MKRNSSLDKISFVIFSFTAIFTLFFFHSCQVKQDRSQENGANIRAQNITDDTILHISNIFLGLSRDEAVKIHGTNYTEDFDFNEMTGDSIEVLKYTDGLQVEVYRTIDKVLIVKSASSNHQTNFGCRVGDSFAAAKRAFSGKFESYYSIHFDKYLPGWYRSGENILIFDPIMDDNVISYENITDTAKIEQIILIAEGLLD